MPLKAQSRSGKERKTEHSTKITEFTQVKRKKKEKKPSILRKKLKKERKKLYSTMSKGMIDWGVQVLRDYGGSYEIWLNLPKIL